MMFLYVLDFSKRTFLVKRLKIFACIAAFSPLFAYAATDNATANNGFFIDGSVGRGSTEYLPTNTVTNIDFGYRWSPWLAVEAGYVDFSKIATFSTWKSKQNGYTLDLSGHWDIASDWYFSARVGAFFWQNTVYASSTSPYAPYGPFRYHDNGTSWHAGLGVGYDFNKNFSLGLNYDWYDADYTTTKVPSLNAEFRF
jgi:OmpA-OmpF porin, OOP family